MTMNRSDLVGRIRYELDEYADAKARGDFLDSEREAARLLDTVISEFDDVAARVSKMTGGTNVYATNLLDYFKKD